jgi:hypothetical protein
VLWNVRFKPMAALGPDGVAEMNVELVGATEVVEG